MSIRKWVVLCKYDIVWLMISWRWDCDTKVKRNHHPWYHHSYQPHILIWMLVRGVLNRSTAMGAPVRICRFVNIDKCVHVKISWRCSCDTEVKKGTPPMISLQPHLLKECISCLKTSFPKNAILEFLRRMVKIRITHGTYEKHYNSNT